MLVCKNCFYAYRCLPDDIARCSHRGDVRVKWNEGEEFYETVDVREPPRDLKDRVKGYIRLCDPRLGYCRKDNCTYAHGEAEQRKWNSILLHERKHGRRPINGELPIFHRRPIPPISQHFGPQFHVNSRPFQPWTFFPTLYQQQRPPQMQPCQFVPPPCQPLNSSHPPQMSCGASNEHFDERVKTLLMLESIEIELTRNSYKEKFHKLLCWEEKTHIEILGDKCNSICDIQLFASGCPPRWIRSERRAGGRFGYILDLNQDKIAYATQASEAAFVVSCDGDLEAKMEILSENFEHCDDYMYIVFESHMEELLSTITSRPIPREETVLKKVSVEFEVKHSYFNSLIRTVNMIEQGVIDRILPSREDFLPFSSISQQELEELLLLPRVLGIHLDQGQLLALIDILTSDPRSPPVLVTGSFGTGKTQLLAVASRCLVKLGKIRKQTVRILVCAHHQATADNLVEKYFGPMLCRQPDDFELIRTKLKIRDKKK